MHSEAKLKSLGLVLSLLLSLSFSSLVFGQIGRRGIGSGGGSFMPAFSDIFFNNRSTGVFQSTNAFTAFFLLFFVVMFGVETGFGSLYQQSQWINVGLAFFISAFAWTRFAPSLIKIARFFDWFAIVGIIVLIIASAQKAHGADAKNYGRS